MKKTITSLLVLSVALLLNSNKSVAQVGIGTTTPHSSAALEINSANKGLLVPRMSEANRPASPAQGLLIYQTDNNPGFYVYNGSAWTAVSSLSVTPSVYVTRANSIYANGNPALGPYFFNPIAAQSSEANLIVTNTAAASSSGTSAKTGFIVPASGTFTKLKLAARVISGGGSTGNSNTTTITLFKNGQATSLSVQVTVPVAVGSSGGAVATGSIAVNAGDVISYQYTQTNQEPNTIFTVVLEGQ